MTSVSQHRSSHSHNGGVLVVLALTLVFTIVFGILSWQRYVSVHTDIDLSIYSQVVWNTAHGDPVRTSVLPFTDNYLGNHFSPMLAVFVPLYLIWADPRILLLAQVFINALAVWPLYWFAQEQLPTAWAGLLLAAAFLLYPALHHQVLAHFHGIALGTACPSGRAPRQR